MQSPSSWRRFFSELKRRNVYKVAATYAVVAFVGFQAAKLLIPSTVLPTWTDEFFLFLLIIGFPVALVVAWAFEMTPGGMRRTTDARSASEKTDAGTVTRMAYRILVGVGIVAAAVAGGWYLTDVGGDDEALPTDRSIAVLPFENMGGEESEQFTQGVHDGLLTRLANISDLLVLSRTSVRQYENTHKTIPEVARELGAAWVVEGAVQQAGGEILVNAQLIRASEDAHQWAQSYRRPLTTENLFDIQGELAKRIARSLEAQLSSGERERVEHRPTGDLEAYQFYVEGRAYLDGRTEDGMRRGLTLFSRAIELDPEFALAWSGFADARWLLAFYGYGSADTLYPQALDAAHRSLRMDSRLAEAHASLGALYRNFLRDGPDALRELRRAVQLRPSYARAYHWLSGVETSLGRPQRGLEHIRKAAELDPRSPPIHGSLGTAYWLTEGPGERALHHARRAVELEPERGGGHATLGLILSDAGRYDEAIASFHRALQREPSGSKDWAVSLAGLGVAHVRVGDTSRARELLDGLAEQEGKSFYEAMIHAALGQETAAFRALQSVEWRSVEAHGVLLPVFDGLRDDPRYERLTTAIDRYWGLNRGGNVSGETRY